MPLSHLSTQFSAAVYAGRKGEDRTVALCCPWPLQPESPHTKQARPSYHLFAVFDGHSGAEAASFGARHLHQIVEALLPPWPTPLLSADPTQRQHLAAKLQQCLALTCLELERQLGTTGCTAGCTATIVLQVGRLVTVASVGSGKCMLDTGDGCLLALSEEHHISSSVSERHRLLAAGCHLAAVDASGKGPADIACRGCGVLRIWPGGLTLSRSIGDFPISPAVLPLPHIKQVMLPPSGGRLVIASDGVWSQAGESTLRTMHTAALKTAAHAVIRAISTSRDGRVDASIVVVDVLQPGDTFQSLGLRQDQAFEATLVASGSSVQEQAERNSGGSKGVLKLLGLGKRKCSKVAPVEEQRPVVRPLPAARAELLADYDVASLLGLVPQAPPVAGSKGSSLVASPAISRANSSTFRGTAAGAAAAHAAEQHRHPVPAWFDEAIELQMRNTMAEAHRLWRQARQLRKAASRQEALQRLSRKSRSDSDLLRLEDAAAIGLLPSSIRHRPSPGSGSSTSSYEIMPEPSPLAAAAMRPSPFAAAGPAPASPAPASPSLQQQQQQQAVAHQQRALAPSPRLQLRRSPSLPRLPSHGLVKVRSIGGTRCAGLPPLPPTPAAGNDRSATAAICASVKPSDSEEEHVGSDSDKAASPFAWMESLSSPGSRKAGSSSSRSLSPPDAAAAIAASAAADLLSPRRRLPPLHVPARQVQAGPAVARGSVPGDSGKQPVSSSSAQSTRRARSLSIGAVPVPSSNSSSRLVAPATPIGPSAVAGAQLTRQKKPASPRQLVGSPNTRWQSAYNLTAGFFTKAGSGVNRRHSSADLVAAGGSRR